MMCWQYELLDCKVRLIHFGLHCIVLGESRVCWLDLDSITFEVLLSTVAGSVLVVDEALELFLDEHMSTCSKSDDLLELELLLTGIADELAILELEMEEILQFYRVLVIPRTDHPISRLVFICCIDSCSVQLCLSLFVSLCHPKTGLDQTLLHIRIIECHRFLVLDILNDLLLLELFVVFFCELTLHLELFQVFFQFS